MFETPLVFLALVLIFIPPLFATSPGSECLDKKEIGLSVQCIGSLSSAGKITPVEVGRLVFQAQKKFGVSMDTYYSVGIKTAAIPKLAIMKQSIYNPDWEYDFNALSYLSTGMLMNHHQQPLKPRVIFALNSQEGPDYDFPKVVVDYYAGFVKDSYTTEFNLRVETEEARKIVASNCAKISKDEKLSHLINRGSRHSMVFSANDFCPNIAGAEVVVGVYESRLVVTSDQPAKMFSPIWEFHIATKATYGEMPDEFSGIIPFLV